MLCTRVRLCPTYPVCSTCCIIFSSEFLTRRRSTLTVSLTKHATNTVLPAFAEGLSHMPNLHTLRVVFSNLHMALLIRGAFEGKQYPQIRAVVLPTCAHNILSACPNVVDVTCNNGDGSQMLSAISKVCKDVEVMEGFAFCKAALINRELHSRVAGHSAF